MELFILLFKIALQFLRIYSWIIMINFIFSWLLMLRIVNLSHPILESLYTFSESVVQPPLQQIRKVVPTIFNIDLSYIVLIFGVDLLEGLLYRTLYSMY